MILQWVEWDRRWLPRRSAQGKGGLPRCAAGFRLVLWGDSARTGTDCFNRSPTLAASGGSRQGAGEVAGAAGLALQQGPLGQPQAHVTGRPTGDPVHNAGWVGCSLGIAPSDPAPTDLLPILPLWSRSPRDRGAKCVCPSVNRIRERCGGAPPAGRSFDVVPRLGRGPNLLTTGMSAAFASSGFSAVAPGGRTAEAGSAGRAMPLDGRAAAKGGLRTCSPKTADRMSGSARCIRKLFWSPCGTSLLPESCW